MAHRIDTSTALKDKFGVGKNGFTRGNPQTGVPATELDDDYFDMLQEEIVGIVEAAGDTLDKTQRNQLNAALGKLFQNKTGATSALGALVPAANRLPYFTGANSASLTDLTPVGRDILASATKAAVLEYLGIGDGPFVSAGGGDYNSGYRFRSVATIPTESNAAELYSQQGAVNAVVSGASFKWYENQFDIGTVRDAAYGTLGFGVQFNGRYTALIKPEGDIFAVRGLFESGGAVRVYSPNNPPPMTGMATQQWVSQNFVQDERLGGAVFVGASGSGSYASITAPAGHVLTAILDASTSRWPMPDSPDSAYARPVQKLINGQWITVGQL